MSATAETLLTKALTATISGSADAIDEVFAEDVVAWSPNFLLTSRAELEEALADRDDALSNVDCAIDWLGTVGHKVMAEWRVAADHTGPFLVGDDVLVEATGRRLMLAGATFAEVTNGRISAIRFYFDDAALLEQLLVD
ncbi:MAG TPA: ester cyclase [Acidimicrobiales bacterium]|nr:ester cyclase [Acidimicrobiales bacterium]